MKDLLCILAQTCFFLGLVLVKSANFFKRLGQKLIRFAAERYT